ncbi:alpha/beta fold hydrolase [Streptomyces sp. ACA25]|uniref:alpha/beta hydrolase n=1 Tax=Streptomyces sp. ACA25 TaxID=3022596 RepID=UPI002306E7D7|nr:alpha/beta fold hydrolase [Streptomyces sp. ACA25]MDB1089903.1 alpha/beta fold hydrolase [Streptomyces sp. ACA25]
MLLLPGAEAFSHDGSATGVLLCHGFTGTPQSMRPWAEYLAERGHTVSLPLLPGHGTRWQDLQRTGWQDWYATLDREFRLLRDRCDQVFLCGLSMGGTLSLRLAAKHGDAVAGVTVVNPAASFPRVTGYFLPLVRHLLPTTKGIASDIAREGISETGYDRVPLHAAHSLRQLFRLLPSDLPQVTQPLLLMRSRRDHVVPSADSAYILSKVSSVEVTERVLEDSYHVATLDHDAPGIFQETDAFMTRLTTRKTTRDRT